MAAGRPGGWRQGAHGAALPALSARQAANGRIRALMKLHHCKNALLIPGAIPCGQPKPFAGHLYRRGRGFFCPVIPTGRAGVLRRPSKGLLPGYISANEVLCASSVRPLVSGRPLFERKPSQPGGPAVRRLLEGRGRRRRQPASPGTGGEGFLQHSYSLLFDTNRGRFYDRPLFV